MTKKMAALMTGLAAGSMYAPDASVIKNLKIGTVNLIEAMREADEGKEEAKALEARRKRLDEDLQKDIAIFNKAKKDFETKAATMSPKAREEEQSRVMKMGRDLESKAQKSEDELKIAMQNASNRLTEKARKQIRKHAETQKLDLVLDIATGQVLYSSTTGDLTKTVIADMNKEYNIELAQNKNESKQATKAT